MSLLEGLLKSEHRSTTRSLTPDDIEGFYSAAKKGHKRLRVQPPMDFVLAYFHNRHGLRMRRLQKDIAWFEKECNSFGYDPREVLGKY